MNRLRLSFALLVCSVAGAFAQNQSVTVDPTLKTLKSPNPLYLGVGGQIIGNAGSILDMRSGTVLLPSTPSTVDNVVSVATMAALRGTSVAGLPSGAYISLRGFATNNDGGGGLFIYDTSSSAADDGGTVIQPTVGTGRWLRAISGAYSPRWFGAKGDGSNSTDDSAAIAAAIAALPTNGVLDFGGPNLTYMVDAEFIITRAMTLMGSGATIKLKNSATIFSTSTGYGRYIFHIRASDVTVDGLRYDGNSPNNTYVVGPTTYYRYSSGGTVHAVAGMIVGFYGAGVAPVDIYRVEIKNCSFKDSSDTCISFLQQADAAKIYDSLVHDCMFLRGQNVQTDFSDCVSCTWANNRYINAYFYSAQAYYFDLGCSFHHNSVRFKSSEIDFSLVNPDLKSGSTSLYFGKVALSKDVAFPHYGLSVTDNVLVGTSIYIPSGVNTSLIANNILDSSETVGIEYAYGGYGNAIRGNTARNCAQTGFYLDAGASHLPVWVEGNRSYGNNTSSAQYGGNDIFSNYYVASDYVIFRNNVARAISSKPLYGIRVATPLTTQNGEYFDNDLLGGGATADILDPSKTGAGHMRHWELAMNFTADLAYDVLPSAVDGTLTVVMGVECAVFMVHSDGTVAKVAGTTNTAATDTPGDLCVVKDGTQAQIINRIGGTQPVRVFFFYL